MQKQYLYKTIYTRIIRVMITSSKQLLVILNTLFLVLGAQLSLAQSVIESNATLLDATIYGQGAELHHKTPQVQVPTGNSEIVINRVSQNIDAQSIRVNSSNSQLTILSVSFESDYL